MSWMSEAGLQQGKKRCNGAQVMTKGSMDDVDGSG
jgi:hypothetical protein